MVGAELRGPDGAPAPALTDAVLERMKDVGCLLGKTGRGRNVLTFLPPLVVTRDELDGLVDRLDEVLACEAGPAGKPAPLAGAAVP